MKIYNPRTEVIFRRQNFLILHDSQILILLTLCELGVEPIVWVGRYAQVAGAQFPRRVLDPQLHWKISMGTVPINMLMAGRTEHTHRSRERREIFDKEEEKSSLKSLDTQNFFSE